MKKGLIASYFSGITDATQGESYWNIIRYALPEFVTALLLYSVPIWIEANFISYLKDTPTFATLGATNNLMHFLIKIGEGVSVGTLVLAGQFNGKADYQEAGRSVRDAFWITCVSGVMVAGSLYLGAYWIYSWLGVPTEIIGLGVPFLRIRAIGVFFMFIYLALVGFVRGIKNTRVPMYVSVLGVFVVISLDYLLIFGKFGFPAMGLHGSALAAVMQYLVMSVAVLVYILWHPDNRKYAVDLFSVFRSRTHMKELLILSWPVMLDKATLAAAYIWLLKMVGPMGSCMVATFCVIKDMERVALTPALAFASVITFLVSNDFGAKNWDAVKVNIKKTVFLASICVMGIFVVFAVMPTYFIGFFDKKGEFTLLAARAFPILSILSFCDLLQVVLSGAIRGTGNVKMVMMVRLLVCGCIFTPLSYALTFLVMDDPLLKFILIYGTFYVCNGLMSVIYINYFRSDRWKKSVV